MIFNALKEASDARDIEAMLALYHPDYTFVRHQHNVALSLEEWRPLMEQMLKSDKLEVHDSRCLYENEDILVMHNVMSFPDGSKEAVLIAHTIKDGKIFRSETGATPM